MNQQQSNDYKKKYNKNYKLEQMNTKYQRKR